MATDNPGASHDPGFLFLRRLLHELRTPLASIVMTAELLEDAAGDEAASRDDRDRYARNLRRAASDAQELIREAEEYARLETRAIELTPSPVRPADLMARLESDLAPEAHRLGVELQVELAPGLPEVVRTDRAAVERIVGGLVAGALPVARRVTLTAAPPAPGAREGRGGLTLGVSDDGPPSPDAERDGAFEPLAKARTRGRRQHGGMGLSLPIYALLAARLGGRLTLDGEGGTTFTLHRPAG
jgi:signal transduction histidine kinase